jgi:tetratricopeptide (TPR) repeat protein
MRKRSILYAIFLIFSLTLHSQDLRYKDSLLQLLPKAKEDTNAVLLYLNVGELYQSNQPNIARSYYFKARDISQKIHYDRGMIKFIGKYGHLLNDHDQRDSALLLYLEAVKLARGLRDSILVAKMLFNVGVTYSYIDDYENSTKYFEKGKIIFEKSNNEYLDAQACEILQNLYFKMRNFSKAIELEEKALSIFRKKNDLTLLKRSLTNLGICYSSIGKSDKAKTLYTEALAISIKTDDKSLQTENYLNIGDCWLRIGNYEQVKLCMDKALSLATEL